MKKMSSAVGNVVPRGNVTLLVARPRQHLPVQKFASPQYRRKLVLASALNDAMEIDGMLTHLQKSKGSSEETIGTTAGILIVAYLPKPSTLIRLLSTVAGSGYPVLVMDNGGAEFIDQHVDVMHLQCVERINCGQNIGVAAALNEGIAIFASRGLKWVAAFDQDSNPHTSAISELLAAAIEWNESGTGKVATIGPTIVDVRGHTKVVHSFISFYRFRIRRIHPENERGSYEVGHVITSGSLINIAAWRVVRFDEDLFIDLVDIDWCWRASNKGYAILGTSIVELKHELSSSPPIKRFGKKLNQYSAIRRYFFARNAVNLIIRRKISLIRRAYLVYALISAILSAFVLDENRVASIRATALGVMDGTRNKMGPAPMNI